MTKQTTRQRMREPALRPTGSGCQLRVVVEAEDYEAALTFFRDVLGLARAGFVLRLTVARQSRSSMPAARPSRSPTRHRRR